MFHPLEHAALFVVQDHERRDQQGSHGKRENGCAEGNRDTCRQRFLPFDGVTALHPCKGDDQTVNGSQQAEHGRQVGHIGKKRNTPLLV